MVSNMLLMKQTGNVLYNNIKDTNYETAYEALYPEAEKKILGALLTGTLHSLCLSVKRAMDREGEFYGIV